jgi:integral membrane sensor domain MASE1
VLGNSLRACSCLRLCGLVVFGDFRLIPVQLHIVTFAVVPLVIGAAIRFGASGASLATLLIASIATMEAAFGSGPFARNDRFIDAILLDVFFGALNIGFDGGSDNL